jgi:outer membrane biosynthesis protein TonB
MKSKQITKHRVIKSQPSPLMTEAVQNIIKAWGEQERIKKTKKIASIKVPVGLLMP